MREIKFRAWHKANQSMVYFNPELLKRGHYQSKYLAALMNGDSGDVLMQYTGLKDKDGVDIYEGDICKVSCYSVHKRWWNTTEEIPVIEAEVEKGKKDKKEYVYPVEFREGSFHLSYVSLLSKFNQFHADSKSIRCQYYHTTFENYCGEWLSGYEDFEVIGNIHENPELLQGAGDE